MKRRSRVALAAITFGLVSLLGSAPGAVAGPHVPPGFFGISANHLLLNGQVDANEQLSAIRGLGTGSIRFPMYWKNVQPYPNMRSVPPELRSQFTIVNGRPTDFYSTDIQVLTLAYHGFQMLPVLLEAPDWAKLSANRQWSPPAHSGDFGRFVAAVVARYGPGGTLWKGWPQYARWAIHAWQIWNEPAGGTTPDGPTLFWAGPEPYESRYIAMLRAARQGARAVDPHAAIVLAGLFGASWKSITALYAKGARGLFDAVAVHAYAPTPQLVLEDLQRVRQALAQEHDPFMPMLVTEAGWDSALQSGAGGPFGIETTPAGQAQNLADLYPLLVAHRRQLNLRAVFWYTWVGEEPSGDYFDYSGLVRLTKDTQEVQPKPAFAAYKRALEDLEH